MKGGRAQVAMCGGLFASVAAHRRKGLAVAGLLLVGMLVPALPAFGSHAAATSPRLVSGPDPLPAPGSTGACGTGRRQQDWEAEPTLSVNPTNGDNLVTAWIQDWADAIVVGSSFDGGATWTSAVPKGSKCTWTLAGEDPPPPYDQYNSAIDPSLSFGPSYRSTSKGTAYLLSIPSGCIPTPDPYCSSDTPQPRVPTSAAVANYSDDGGRTWSNPAMNLPLDTGAFPTVIDGSNVIADPKRSGVAWAQWSRNVFSVDPTTGALALISRALYYSETSTGGETWSPPSQIPMSEPNRLQVVGSFQVLDGTLVDVFSELPASPPGTSPERKDLRLFITRLSDPTNPLSRWSTPREIAETDPTRAAVSSAATDGKTIYVSWTQVTPARCPAEPRSCFSLMYSRSSDGEAWEGPAFAGDAIPGPPETGAHSYISAAPGLAVASDGTVGVTFYDHRKDKDDSTAPELTDYWFRHLHNGSTKWEEDDHLAGPFDQTRAPSPEDGSVGGLLGFLGDYQGMAPLPAGGFVSTFALSEPLVQNPCTRGIPPFNSAPCNTDIFFSRIRTPQPDLQVTNIVATPNRARQGDKVIITATVKNAGDADATASKTEFLLDGTIVLGLADTPAIAAGASTNVSVNWDTRAIKGDHTIRVTADRTSLVAESNENNNTATLIVTVQGNKVTNGSFEQANSTGSGPGAWTGSSTGAGTVSWSAGGSVGSRSASVTGNGGSAVLSGSPTWTSDPIAVAGGENLSLRVSVNSVGASSAPTAGLAYLDALGQVIGVATAITAPVSTGGFITLESSVVIPAGVAQVRVVLSGFSPLDVATAGTVTFDDMGLYGG